MQLIGRVRAWVWRRPELAMLAVIAVPLLVSLVNVAGTHWYPTGDYAHTELNVRAIPAHPPLIGVAGRFGPIDDQGSHPGPSMAYLLYPVYFLFGHTSFGLLVSTTVLHFLAVVLAVVVARRVGGTSLAVLVAAAAATLDHSLGAQFFLTPWNPWMPVLAFFAFLVLVFGVARGRLGLVPVAVFVGTHAAQTHVSYVVLVHGMMGLLLVWLVTCAWRGWNGVAWPRLGRSLAAGAAVAVVMWLPPIYDQFRRTHNLMRIYHHFTDSTEPTVGLRAATRALLTEWNLGGAFLSGARHDPATSPPSLTGFVLFTAVLVAGLLVALRRRDTAALTLQGVAFAAAALGWISTTRIIGDFYDYVIRWTWTVGVLLLTAALWAIWRAIADRAVAAVGAAGDGPVPPADVSAPRHNAAARRFAVLTAVGVALPSLLLVRQSVHVDIPYAAESRLVGGLAGELRTKLDEHNRYLLRWHDPAGLGGPGFGLMLEMERHGFHLGSDLWTRFAVLQFRVYDESTVTSVLWLVTGQASIDRFKARGDAEELAAFDPRTPDQQQRSDADRAEILRRLGELGRQDLIDVIDSQYGNAALIAAGHELPADVNRLVSEYTDLRLPGAVFQVAPGSPLFP